MGRCFVPSNGPGAWRALLAQPDKHWKSGYSAKALAHCWEAGDQLPYELASLIKTIPRFESEEPDLLLAIPEWKVPLPGGRRDSQNDALALIGVGDELIVAAIEGKVSESFGETIESWFANPSDGKKARLRYLCELLGMDCPPEGHLRYQLFHRAASAVIECNRFRAQTPAMIVHSFSAVNAGFEDYAAFASALGGSPELDRFTEVDLPHGSKLLLGWARGDRSFLRA